MDTACLCSSIRLLANAETLDESRARDLIPALNGHLGDLRRLLGRSKSLFRDVQYHVAPRNQRTSKALSVDAVDLAPANRMCERFREDVDGFWAAPNDDGHGAVNPELRRRLACVVIFLRSKLDAQVLAQPQIASLFSGSPNFADVRNSGRKYIQIARKLGGLGSILWLPLDIPPSTYERYLNIDDEEIFSHLTSLAPSEDYTGFVQRLVLSQLRDSSLSSSYYNLFVDYADIIPASDQLLLLLHALGGSQTPESLLTRIRLSQRRWNTEGEIESVSAADFGLSPELITLLSNDVELANATASPYVVKHALDDESLAWSLCPELSAFFSRVLLPKTMEELGVAALKILCFVCPPCYEGNLDWSPTVKKVIWPIVENVTKTCKIPTNLRTQVLELVLFFCERDSVPVRHAAVNLAKTVLRKSMPYYLHATVVLFRSTLYRIDGDFARSEADIRDFIWRGPRPTTRRDRALEGRLHISRIETKIRSFDNDIPSFIYEWKAEQPLSAMEIEVTFRLQSTAARYFQSVGEFSAARASLEQILSLDGTRPIRGNTRRMLTQRLADICSEMGEHVRAIELLQAELHNLDRTARSRRPFRRLLLALLDANIGLGDLDAAALALREIEEAEPLGMEDLHDQQLHMRAVIAAARIAHAEPGRPSAVMRWEFALQEVQRMNILGAGGGFTAALIYLSLAHAQLAAGDRDGTQQSWGAGSEILKTEICEFWLPLVPTSWLQRIALEVYESEGWTLRMMLPGSKPDVTIP
ncbi:LipA and NB-ARC domain-containing protein [Colletotrichum plurivorum]|uniref:LipA and NB-ARC domain-containing protein n=1 Tax=Colletotrichum plurivorum TaxID=2175906 RepID=A0A8H6K0U3_9PEZI|nr:LipA and NB-ARC domain-containing protein [Colletotrichum plurivorum]